MAKQTTTPTNEAATPAAATPATINAAITAPAQAKEPKTVKGLLDSVDYQNRLKDLLKDRASLFITSVIQLVNQDSSLKDCEPNSVINAALVATSLELPINKSLGFAYVIAYNNKQPDGTYRKEAQFQLGYRGYKQLAQRTGRFELLNQSDVREGELKRRDRLTGEIDFEWIEDDNIRLAAPVIGYVSFFKLSGGFRSTFYMTVQEMELHARTYSKGYAADLAKLKSNPRAYVTSKWITDKPAMSLKTVIKLNLDKNAPLSIEDKNFEALRLALKADQAVITNFENNQFEYPDNEEIPSAEIMNNPTAHAEKAGAAIDATLSKITDK